MRKLVLLLVAMASFFVFSCGGSLEVSPEMQGFMDEITATNSIIEAAEKYGYNASKMPFEGYELKEPKVTKIEKDGAKTKYFINVKHGVIDSDVIIIWKDKIIVDIKDIN